MPTSTSSSTSDRATRAQPGVAARASGLFRLVHPFPSLLTSSASAGIAALAGGDPGTIVRLFFAMLGLQVAIGSLNDVIDAPSDAVAKPRKPIPLGLVSPAGGSLMAAGGAICGLGLSAVSGPATLTVGAACLALGWLYDLRLSRTALSWLPLALALPLLPVHAWLGAAGLLPASLWLLVPVGVLAGAGLALANGLVDIDRDAETRRASLVVRLGRRPSWALQTALLAAAAGLALILAPNGTPPGATLGTDVATALATVRRWGIVLGCGLLALGAIGLLASRAAIRERGWELEAIGVVGLGLGWLAGTSPADTA